MSDEIYLNFTLSKEQYSKLLTWKEEHEDVCSLPCRHPFPKGGSAGERFSYEFLPTGIGTITYVKCACGEQLDLTDYEEW